MHVPEGGLMKKKKENYQNKFRQKKLNEMLFLQNSRICDCDGRMRPEQHVPSKKKLLRL